MPLTTEHVVLYDAAVDKVRHFRCMVGDAPHTRPYLSTWAYLSKLLQEVDDSALKTPSWVIKRRLTLKALLGPHGFTIFKMLRIRSGMDKTRG